VGRVWTHTGVDMRQQRRMGSWGLAVAGAMLGSGAPAIAQESEPFMRVVESDDD